MRCTGYEMARYKGTQASHLYEKSMHTLCTIQWATAPGRSLNYQVSTSMSWQTPKISNVLWTKYPIKICKTRSMGLGAPDLAHTRSEWPFCTWKVIWGVSWIAACQYHNAGGGFSRGGYFYWPLHLSVVGSGRKIHLVHPQEPTMSLIQAPYLHHKLSLHTTKYELSVSLFIVWPEMYPIDFCIVLCQAKWFILWCLPGQTPIGGDPNGQTNLPVFL